MIDKVFSTISRLMISSDTWHHQEEQQRYAEALNERAYKPAY